MIDKLKNSFAQALDVKAEKINSNLEYRGIDEWDSISHMFLISQIEEDFEISISADDVLDMSSFNKAIEIVNKLVSEK